jgi:hypothetical protein
MRRTEVRIFFLFLVLACTTLAFAGTAAAGWTWNEAATGWTWDEAGP